LEFEETLTAEIAEDAEETGLSGRLTNPVSIRSTSGESHSTAEIAENAEETGLFG